MSLRLFGAYSLQAGRLLHTFSARVDNVTDERYASTELLLGGLQAVAPGTGREFRVGVQFDLR